MSAGGLPSGLDTSARRLAIGLHDGDPCETDMSG
jgi:hypothetical protein